jgi:hypothetical protein
LAQPLEQPGCASLRSPRVDVATGRAGTLGALRGAMTKRNNNISIFMVVAMAAATAAATSACGRGGAGEGSVPDAETFFMALPEDEGDDASSSSAEQAACVSTEGYDDLKARIEVYNEAIRARVGLIKRMVRAAERNGGGTVTRTATSGGFTATMTAVDDGEGHVTYNVTIENPDGESATLLEGESNADLSAGSWDFQGLLQNRTVHVDWTNDGEVLTVDRTATGDFGTRTSHSVRTADTVTITFSGPEHDGSAEWSRETKDGSITVDGTQHCWDANDDLTEFCSVDCPTT